MGIKTRRKLGHMYYVLWDFDLGVYNAIHKRNGKSHML